MDFLLLLNFFVLSFQLTGLASLSYNYRFKVSSCLFLLQLPIYLPYCYEVARLFTILSSNPFEFLLLQPLLLGTTYLLELMGLLYLCLYVYSEVLYYHDQGAFHFIFQERDDSENEESTVIREYSRSPERSNSRNVWPRSRNQSPRINKAPPSLYDMSPKLYTERRLEELYKCQQFKDMDNELIRSKWKGSIPEPTETEINTWLEEYAGRRDLLSGDQNEFQQNAFSAHKLQARKNREVRRLNTMHNPRVSSKSMKNIYRPAARTFFKHD